MKSITLDQSGLGEQGASEWENHRSGRKSWKKINEEKNDEEKSSQDNFCTKHWKINLTALRLEEQSRKRVTRPDVSDSWNLWTPEANKLEPAANKAKRGQMSICQELHPKMEKTVKVSQESKRNRARNLWGKKSDFKTTCCGFCLAKGDSLWYSQWLKIRANLEKKPK